MFECVGTRDVLIAALDLETIMYEPEQIAILSEVLDSKTILAATTSTNIV